jgi:hypothetical protein
MQFLKIAAASLLFLPFTRSVAQTGTNASATPDVLLRPAYLTSVNHDGTLNGDGTAKNPLKISVPLTLQATPSTATTPVIAAYFNNTPWTGDTGYGTGIEGSSIWGPGVVGRGPASGLHTGGGNGVEGYSGYGAGIFGMFIESDGPPFPAGEFVGDVTVTGNLSKAGGSFKIDHPLDPANKYLSHSFVESPDMMNIYNGNVVTDANGLSTVQMPSYFEALNRDFRYQLTVIGQFAQAIVAQEIQNGVFTIRTDKPNVKVSWMVTGVRQDTWANAHRIPVEEDKPEAQRGKYLHPELFKQTEDKSLYAEKKQQYKARWAAQGVQVP